MRTNSHVALAGSERQLPADARAIGAVDPGARMEVTVMLRPKADRAAMAARMERGDIQPMSREEFAAVHGADENDMDRVEEVAHANGLTVTRRSPESRTIALAGPAEAMLAMFPADVKQVQHAGATYRMREGEIGVPKELADIVEGVIGLDNRPAAEPHYRYYPPMETPQRGVAGAAGAGPAAPPLSFTPPQIAALYNFPQGLTGNSQTVAIIELGGGFRPVELNNYFHNLGINPPPPVSAVSVDGALNQPGVDPNSDVEVVMDIEIVGGCAPGAKVAVYFAPNTTRGFLDAILAAVHDSQRKPSIISISWGSSEDRWSAQDLRAYNRAFQDAAALNVTVCAASGDNGSTDGVPGAAAHCDFPASDPFVLGCGGTTLQVTNNTLTGEVVWDKLAHPGNGTTGGGVSDKFPLPAYQVAAHVPPSVNPPHHPGRGVPDVAGNADPDTGYRITVNGQTFPGGGTSAVAPLWSALVARMNEGVHQPMGFLHPKLYHIPPAAGAFRDITNGHNPQYAAGPGYDACTGLGSPNGTKLFQALEPLFPPQVQAVVTAMPAKKPRRPKAPVG